MKTDSGKKENCLVKNVWPKQFFSGSMAGGNEGIVPKMTISEYHFGAILRLENEKCEKKKIVQKNGWVGTFQKIVFLFSSPKWKINNCLEN